MASLPIPYRRRRQNKAAETLQTVAKAWAALNVASAAPKAAKQGAKAYGAAKGAKVVGRPVAKVAVVPVALLAGGGLFAVVRKRRAAAAQQQSGSVTPAAHASTVSPPSDPGGSLTDPPAGAVNPPVGPRAAT